MFRTFVLGLAGTIAFASTPVDAATLFQYDFSPIQGSAGFVDASNVATGLRANLFTPAGVGLFGLYQQHAMAYGGWRRSAPGFDPGYLRFSVDVISGYVATVTQVTFGAQSGDGGPGLMNLLASVDGGAFAIVGSFRNTSFASPTDIIIDIATPLIARSNINFRIADVNGDYVGTGNVNGGQFSIFNSIDKRISSNPFSVNGAVGQEEAVPEPATWGLMLAGFGMIGAGLRTRRRNTTVTFA